MSDTTTLRSTAEHALDFEFDGKKYHVDPGGTWECPAKLVGHALRRGLPFRQPVVEAQRPAPPAADERPLTKAHHAELMALVKQATTDPAELEAVGKRLREEFKDADFQRLKAEIQADVDDAIEKRNAKPPKAPPAPKSQDDESK